jgi:hypothetical protein
MMRLKPGEAARVVVEGCRTTIEHFADGIIADEESMTDRLFGSVANALNGRTIGGIVWKARTLRTGRGIAAEEKRHGADVLGVLEINLPEFRTRKGFLLQAKRIEPHEPISTREWDRFRKQCDTMLGRTHEAFAVIYSRTEGVRFIPAATINEITRTHIFDAGSRSLFGFFRAHVKCEIGDRKLHSPTIEVLDHLARQPGRPLTEDDNRMVLAMKAGA